MDRWKKKDYTEQQLMVLNKCSAEYKRRKRLQSMKLDILSYNPKLWTIDHLMVLKRGIEHGYVLNNDEFMQDRKELMKYLKNQIDEMWKERNYITKLQHSYNMEIYKSNKLMKTLDIRNKQIKRLKGE